MAPVINGYAGRILRVDLTTGGIAIEQPPEQFYRRYLGGSGFVGYYLLAEIPPGADPLGPDNRLIFAAGPVTGIGVAGAGRNAMGAKSPLTGGYGEADVGGFFGAEMRRAGFDAVIVHGRSPRPVYLWLHSGEAEIHPSDHLWGMTTLACETAVREELGERTAHMAMIGPSGEKLVRFACVINDVRHAAGRTGLGAVMGSKNLKCVVACGRQAVPVANEKGIKELATHMRDHWRDDVFGLHDTGTAGGLLDLNEAGALPTRNFQDGQFEEAEAISGQRMRDTILLERGSCFACAVRCKRVVEVKDERRSVDLEYGGPEYETIGAFGSNCGVADLEAVAEANELCNALGLDTISTGMMVSFAMECFEAGLITKQDTGGLELRFGNAEAMVELTRQIGQREGLGDLLAEGPVRAADKIGGNAHELAIHVKGQPFPMHECRTRHGQALGYAVSPTGADHMHNIWDEQLAHDPLDETVKSLGIYERIEQTTLDEAKIRAYIYCTNWSWLGNQIGCCAFIPWSRDQVVQLIRCITGWRTNTWELMKAAERGVNMARLFNLREGLTRADDVLPVRMAQPHVRGSVHERPIAPEALEWALTMYYSMMGWHPRTGEPTAGKIHELDLGWASAGRDA